MVVNFKLQIEEKLVAMDEMIRAELEELNVRESRFVRNGTVAEAGVLLYYKFARIDDPEEMKNWLFDHCSSLGLLGRIRVAPDGINITVGGKMAALQEHIKVVSANALFEGTDFKLASCFPPVDKKAAAECGFTSLSARTVKELVTLGLHPTIQPPSISDAGRHATAQEFHEILEGRAKDKASLKKTVVVDARNVYETRIGKFSAPEGVEVLDPMIRQYSDLPRWIEENEERLRNKQILMYCTGGVRCEMGSAYIRSKGKEFEDVVQLSGGIQRYMEAFSDGGFFLGKNFVFDHRLAVPTSNPFVVGRCLQCNTPYDDYSARCRCSFCRMLVLICSDCQIAAQESGGPHYICEVCTKTGKSFKSNNRLGSQSSLQCEGYTDNRDIKATVCERKDASQRQRKLRILCLHGFRQNASKLKGRLNALRKKLRHKVELVYIDAPHELSSSFCHEHHSQHPLDNSSELQKEECCLRQGSETLNVSSYSTATTSGVSKKFAWLLSPSTMICYSRVPCEGLEMNYGNTVDETRSDIDLPCVASSDRCSPQGPVQCLRLGPVEFPSVSGESEETCLSQHQTQTAGWSRSWEYLQKVFREQGPFDGVLGFSQGAAIAAALCLSSMRNSERCAVTVKFRFVMLCSGFISPSAEHFETMSSLKGGAIDFPSLHIFGGCEGSDRQISVNESEQLASLFRAEKRVIVRHQSGHIIPTQREYVHEYLSFLDQFD